jgi:hypothetical protein
MSSQEAAGLQPQRSVTFQDLYVQMSQDPYVQRLVIEQWEKYEALAGAVGHMLDVTPAPSKKELETLQGKAFDHVRLQHQRVDAVQTELKQTMVAWIISHQLLRQGLGLEEGGCRGRAIERGQLGGRRGQAMLRRVVRRCRPLT